MVRGEGDDPTRQAGAAATGYRRSGRFFNNPYVLRDGLPSGATGPAITAKKHAAWFIPNVRTTTGRWKIHYANSIKKAGEKVDREPSSPGLRIDIPEREERRKKGGPASIQRVMMRGRE